MRLAVAMIAAVLTALLSVGSEAVASAPSDEEGQNESERNDVLEAVSTVTNEPGPPPPPPDCWWSNLDASSRDLADERAFWRRIDGGEFSDDVLVFFEDGSLHRTFLSEQRTYVLQVRVCSDTDHEEYGRQRWTVVGPPNPTVYWDELTERVTKRVPLPEPNLGFARQADGSVDIAVNLGLWIAVDNPDDVVARAEPAPGVWAETRATLDQIEFLSGTGGTSGPCVGAGTPLADPASDVVEQGPCGYTYTSVDELGEHTAILRATWIVTNTTSTGASERRPDIVLDTLIPVEVYEVQTVGTG